MPIITALLYVLMKFMLNSWTHWSELILRNFFPALSDMISWCWHKGKPTFSFTLSQISYFTWRLQHIFGPVFKNFGLFIAKCFKDFWTSSYVQEWKYDCLHLEQAFIFVILINFRESNVLVIMVCGLSPKCIRVLLLYIVVTVIWLFSKSF
jgi:hypothetical protein